MAKEKTQRDKDLNEIRDRLDWLDQERRKSSRRLVELEQRITVQEREIGSREKRIQELESKLSRASSDIARLSQFDDQLKQLKDELVKQIDQYDERRKRDNGEQEKLRRVEHEIYQREIADLRKEIVPISRLENDMELRQSEESRLANMLGGVQNRVTTMSNNIEKWGQELKFVDESERTNARAVAELQSSILENSKRFEPIETRLDVASHNLVKAQTRLQEVISNGDELRQNMTALSEQIQVGEYERNQQIDNSQRTIDEKLEEMNQFATEWVKYAEQYQEAKTAVQRLEEWQEHIEQQQRDSTELTRVEANRMRSLWDGFLLEDEKRWKNFEVDREQRWSGAERRNKQFSQALNELSEQVTQMQQDKDVLWRLQNAQADAVKKWARIWLEESEKAIKHNPNSRRQPAFVPVRDD
jgi:chromosome segregation ATPase